MEKNTKNTFMDSELHMALLAYKAGDITLVELKRLMTIKNIEQLITLLKVFLDYVEEKERKGDKRIETSVLKILLKADIDAFTAGKANHQ